jgi:putative endonuclease
MANTTINTTINNTNPNKTTKTNKINNINNINNPNNINSSNKSNTGRLARVSGYEAESAACLWLESQGLVIVARNVRYCFGELDIVAWQGNVLVLFEVRLRKNTRFGTAADSVTPTKQKRLLQAATAYAAQLSKAPMMRIDLLAYDGTDSISQPPLWLKNILG